MLGIIDPVTALLFAGGFVWWSQMLRRVREDVVVLRTSTDGSEKAAVGGLWVVTVLIGMWMLGTVKGFTSGLLYVSGVTGP